MFAKWPGSTIGVRQPAPGETPLSWDEVAYGVKKRLFRHGPKIPALPVNPDEVDDDPVKQSWRAVGTWERREIRRLAPAHVWEGLQ